MTIRDSSNYTKVVLYSYYITITGWGANLLTPLNPESRPSPDSTLSETRVLVMTSSFTTYVGMYVCMYACMHACMHACMDGWMDGWYVCMYVCMYVPMYLCIYIYIQRCIEIYIYICMCTCIQRLPLLNLDCTSPDLSPCRDQLSAHFSVGIRRENTTLNPES